MCAQRRTVGSDIQAPAPEARRRARHSAGVDCPNTRDDNAGIPSETIRRAEKDGGLTFGALQIEVARSDKSA
jgi:hypothetical protein